MFSIRQRDNRSLADVLYAMRVARPGRIILRVAEVSPLRPPIRSSTAVADSTRFPNCDRNRPIANAAQRRDGTEAADEIACTAIKAETPARAVPTSAFSLRQPVQAEEPILPGPSI